MGKLACAKRNSVECSTRAWGEYSNGKAVRAFFCLAFSFLCRQIASFYQWYRIVMKKIAVLPVGQAGSAAVRLNLLH